MGRYSKRLNVCEAMTLFAGGGASYQFGQVPAHVVKIKIVQGRGFKAYGTSSKEVANSMVKTHDRTHGAGHRRLAKWNNRVPDYGWPTITLLCRCFGSTNRGLVSRDMRTIFFHGIAGPLCVGEGRPLPDNAGVKKRVAEDPSCVSFRCARHGHPDLTVIGFINDGSFLSTDALGKAHFQTS